MDFKNIISLQEATENQKYNFRKSQWKSANLLQNLDTKSFISVSKEIKDSIHDEMWINLAAEYDSINLSKYLKDKKHIFSDAFLSFEKIWLQDELNHYFGLKKIYCELYGFDEQVVHANISKRVPNFVDIEEFLRDEFTLCVCFAYDELASTKGYAEAFPLYDSFCLPEVSRWIRLVARDELYHSLNAQEIINLLYYDKLQDVAKVLQKIVSHDSSSDTSYNATFLFDHDYDPINNPFSEKFLKKCANDICRYLSIQLAFQE